MFEERYDRMMEGVEPSQELVQRTVRAGKQQRLRTGTWKPVLVIALCVMMAGAAAWQMLNTPDTSRLAAQPPPTAAPTPLASPSVLECAYDGMTLRYLSSWADEEKIYVTLSVEGEKLPEQLSISLRTDTGASGHAQMINHDPEKHRSIFFASFALDSRYPVISEDDRSATWLNPVIDLSQPISLHVTGYTSYLCLPIGDVLPLDEISTTPAMQLKSRTELINGYDNKDFMTYWESGYPVLVPGAVIGAPVGGYALVAAGYADDRLHVMLANSIEDDPKQGYAITQSSLHPILLPKHYTGNTFSDELPSHTLSQYECFSWRDEAEQVYYQNFVFDFSRKELLSMSEELQLCLRGFLSLSLPDSAASPMVLTFTLGE